ncbi:sigma-70 family RNA polymerase sigma factor [Candidatus Saccharibacteria bacterium]|nr:sigma-70 family RNA polymerase sigma factor [Candidatus Saccharibacteria bacterium]NIV04422.1 sigma-70 family RNA polymerase sigma factor [Calditrichia bacterium]NIS38959.1 sigma-70 family RNA polymerase sigma factor [Candidatus Saccharibacteria bacterium]NIV72970.1 sigma-70 family RNA polymerase sigma factor [Calditrichia bacterium]NIW00226.1 sigma-70 family RNA polymerase sigma factor [Candidatus Saccharibacteria bacterium]
MDREREKILVAKAQKNIEAFDELYDYYLPKIFGYILNRVGHRQEAEDLTSQTFAKVLANLSRYEERGVSFSAWVYRIATNVIIDNARKKKEYSMDPEIIKERVAGTRTASPEEQVCLLETGEEMRYCLDQLKEDYQNVLTLKFFEELDNREIAKILDCRPSAVAVKVHRALKALKKEFEVMKNQQDELYVNF